MADEALAAEVEGPLRVVMLDRPRHRPMMEAARAVGAALSLIADGDVMGALHDHAQMDPRIKRSTAP